MISDYRFVVFQSILVNYCTIFSGFFNLNVILHVAMTHFKISARKQSKLVPRGPFCHALEIGTPGQVQRHSGFEWLCKHNRLRPEPIRFVRLDSGHAQSDGKSVNRGLPVLDLARGRDPRLLTKRIAASGNEIVQRVLSHRVWLSLIVYSSTSQRKCLQIPCIFYLIWTCAVGPVMSPTV